MLKKILYASVLATAGFAGAAHATPTNLLVNGSFENGSGSTSSFTTTGQAVTILTYGTSANANNTNLVADTVTPDFVANASDSPSTLPGTHGAYFYVDGATQTLSQTISLPAGNYEVGFDFALPANGFANSQASTLTSTAVVNSNTTTLLSTTTAAEGVANTWLHVFADVTLPIAASLTYNFTYSGPAVTNGNFSQDVVVDDVYVINSSTGGTIIATPEPASFALLGAGLTGLAFFARRKRRG